MSNLRIIAAIGKNRELEKNNELIWRIKEDMHFFRDATMNKKIIMGRSTFESLPRLLPKREHIVLSKQNIDLGESVKVLHNIKELLEYLNKFKEEAMVIGGAKIYIELMEYSNKMLLTFIDESAPADAYFPQINDNDWEKTILGTYQENNINYKRVQYTKK